MDLGGLRGLGKGSPGFRLGVCLFRAFVLGDCPFFPESTAYSFFFYRVAVSLVLTVDSYRFWKAQPKK